MKVTEQDVTYVADLANLELTEQERLRMVQDLDSILTYIGHLNELDTTNVPPMAQVFEQTAGAGSLSAAETAAAFRKDEPRPSLPHEEALRNAPVSNGDFFKVPKVIEK